MSDEREELAKVIESVYWSNGNKFRRSETEVAEAILAAGYRKPRTITTVEELDALANDSVVLDADRATATRLDADYWEVAGYASHFRIDAITLPATVLHVGGAE